MKMTNTNTTVESLPILGRPAVIQAGFHLTHHLAADLAQLVGPSASRLVIVTDTNVAALHLDPLVAALRAAWAAASEGTTKIAANLGSPNWLLTFVLPPGEAAKTRATKSTIEDWMLAHGCTRDTVVLALGGGVVGDMVGYVAATYMRGCAIVQVPTTLLAMVDSAIGGKTAVDVPAGKNLIGAFHQPLRVYIDPAYLATLPMREIKNGMAEVIKTAAFASADDFALLEHDPERVLKAMASPNAVDPLVLKVIFGSARVKAEVVSADEKEGGLRGLLNFGHTVGHAFEAALTPYMLHGECVSIGMVHEAEMSRRLGHLDQGELGRLVRCISAYGLPVSIHDSLVGKYLAKSGLPQHVAVDRLLDYMKVDKKNSGANKRLVLLSKIGATVEPRASIVSDDIIRLVVSPGVQVVAQPSPASPTSTATATPTRVTVPGSKSISNRALLLAALSTGTTTIHNLLHSDDTQVMLTALQRLGACSYTWDKNVLIVHGHGGKLTVPQDSDAPIYLGNAGTAARFLTCTAALVQGAGPLTVTGNARMQQRPIKPLVEAMQANGIPVTCSATGCLPITVKTGKGVGFPGGKVQLAASISSQYVSAILICAPFAKEEVKLELVGGKVISETYIDMTIAMMRSFGVHVTKVSSNLYHIPRHSSYTAPGDYIVEPDASSATYPLAVAAITGRAVTGDARFALDVLAPMGCTVTQSAAETTVVGPAPGKLRALGNIDMEHLTDAFLTAAVLAAVANAPNAQDGSTRTVISGIANQRVKECNRIKAMRDELAKFGVETDEHEDGLTVVGKDWTGLVKSPAPSVYCYDDHRVAMSFSVLGTLVGANVEERKCVEKTWPAWWDTLEGVLGVQVGGYDVVPSHGPAHKAAASKAQQGPAASVVLIGMRGAGKTSLGRAAARDLGYTFLDVDEEFVRRHDGQPIGEYVAAHGGDWSAFRRKEAELLRELVAKCPTQTVIACGGGVVETPESRNLLKGLEGHVAVIHVRRKMEHVLAELESSNRPSLGEPASKIWERRRAWYETCAGAEFFAAATSSEDGLSSYDWAAVEAQFAEFVKSVTASTANAEAVRASMLKRVTGSTLKVSSTASPLTSFVSLTLPQITDQQADLIRHVTQATDAVELRVDLLAQHDVESVASAFFTLRRIVGPNLPIIFTIRTQSQAGTWPDTQQSQAVDLLSTAIRWGTDMIDIETTLPLQTLKSLQVQAKSRGVLTLLSYHDPSGTYSFHKHRVHWCTQLYLAAAFGDIVKLVGRAHSIQDNHDLASFVERVARDLLGYRTPLIAIHMGPHGQLSRVLNKVLTPVTHEDLAAAAPGQMSIKQIHHALGACGVIQPRRKFYLLGHPIEHSRSPAMHNAGFQALGLPFTYDLHSASEVDEPLRQLVSKSNSQFGGCSVTIPLKEKVHVLCDQVTPAARAIGAINTISFSKDGSQLVGDNTDVEGIRVGIRTKWTTGGRHSEKEVVSALVLGAGGTAARPAQALIKDFAEIALAREVELLAVGLDDTVPADGGFAVVVSTLPRDVQQARVEHGDKWPQAWFSETQVLVEMVYGEPTPIVQAALAQRAEIQLVHGMEVLLEQGVGQFERWTGMRAPREAMTEGVYGHHKH
ncbi:EPSP synthase-domain-containing protein [Catenaria anguillulae PL171]|uniref:Pentafunctional AROM polypeptide n=1 Tax=Catenaria anguillulae PL171 TaxID=765915 RepID=A0A1Y2HMB5_9FUNG|nr:EPSP synthase-domain-containing protein [Catenaria anguillulae PL171]